MQQIKTDEIECPCCGEVHISTLVAFPDSIEYKGVRLNSVEYYHICNNSKVFFQTPQDIVHTFIAERVTKKRYDQMLQQSQGWNIGI